MLIGQLLNTFGSIESYEHVTVKSPSVHLSRSYCITLDSTVRCASLSRPWPTLGTVIDWSPFYTGRLHIRETNAMAENDDVELPFVVATDLGQLPQNGIALRITFASSAERFESRQWDTAVYGMSRNTAVGLVKSLQRILDNDAQPPKPPRH
jgi:hypothetical protein